MVRIAISKGVVTKFCLGDGFMGTQTHLPPKFSFSSDFGHFNLKMLKNSKFSFVSRKKVPEISSFLGDVPRRFLDWGTHPPSPAFDAHGNQCSFCMRDFKTPSFPRVIALISSFSLPCCFGICPYRCLKVGRCTGSDDKDIRRTPYIQIIRLPFKALITRFLFTN